MLVAVLCSELSRGTIFICSSNVGVCWCMRKGDYGPAALLSYIMSDNNKCRCGKTVKNGYVCGICGTVYHSSCLGSDGLFCCDSPLQAPTVRPRRSSEASLSVLPPIYLESVTLYRELNESYKAQIECYKARIRDLEALLAIREAGAGPMGSAALAVPTVASPVSISHGVASDVPRASGSLALASEVVASGSDGRSAGAEPVSVFVGPSSASAPRGGGAAGAGGLRSGFVGSAVGDPSVGLAAASPVVERKWYYIGNLKPGTTVANLTEFISNTFNITGIKCFGLVNGNEYASFKIGVRIDDVAVIMNPSKWMAGVMVREFRFRRSHTRSTFPVISGGAGRRRDSDSPHSDD